MVSDGVSPNVVTWSSLISAFAQVDLVQHAIHTFDEVLLSGYEPSLKRQLLMSTIFMTVSIAIVSCIALPSNFTLYDFGVVKPIKNWHFFFCVAIGLWAGLIIGYTMEYYTSNTYSPVQDVASSCRIGATTNVICDFTLGYKSVIIPIFAIVVAIYVGFSLAAIYGLSVAVLGMLMLRSRVMDRVTRGGICESSTGIELLDSVRRVKDPFFD
ncbi:pyrophosphate-energized vacuolar membrane proton pump-like [Aristolochia californica]|uniref:pyrophosphate-energized vacuolar membrane proton pump-like n=1 Tax=Aristolochia californica TaxID=171875 RepID=UPI0035D5956B